MEQNQNIKPIQPKVSVIIPTHNREAFIREAIDSVLAQSFKDWEIVVIDDASEDKTESVIKEYSQEYPRIKYIKNDINMGIARTRNRGLKLARGKYIAPLDSDDIWLDKDKLKKQVEFLDVNTDYALLGGGIMHIDKESKSVKKVLFPVYDSVIRNIILQYNPFAQSSLLFRKSVALEFGGYSTKYKICDDYELWLKIGGKYKFTNIPQVLTGYRIHGSNITHTHRLTAAREILEIVKTYAHSYKRAPIGILKAYTRVLLCYFKS